ncbi:MAG: hypothetical protein AAFP69_20710, partial [Planctomycetota bacterium]
SVAIKIGDSDAAAGDLMHPTDGMTFSALRRVGGHTASHHHQRVPTKHRKQKVINQTAVMRCC